MHFRIRKTKVSLGVVPAVAVGLAVNRDKEVLILLPFIQVQINF